MNDTRHKAIFRPGDHVRIHCGSTFDGYEGVVAEYPTKEAFVRFTIMVFDNAVELVLEPSKLAPVATQM